MRRIAVALGLVGVLAFLIPVRADDDAKPREVIARAIMAQGGSDNLTKFKASVAKTKGKFHGLGIDYTSEMSFQLPNRLRNEVHSKVGGRKFTDITVIDGNKGWMKSGDKTEGLEKEMLAELKELMNAANITHLICLMEKDYKLSPLREVRVGDRLALGIRVQRKGYRDVNLFFDKDKNLLLKMETRGKVPKRGGEEYTATTLYGAYKKVKGMMVPHKITIKRDGEPIVESETLEVKVSEKLDDNLFEKP